MALAAALAIIAVVLAVLLSTPTGSPPPVAGPASTPAASSPPGSAPSGSAAIPLPPHTTGTAAPVPPEEGQTPVQPPATLPPPPVATPPDARSVPPPEPFPAQFRNQDLTVIPGAGRTIALTFDAGANAAGLLKILSALTAKRVAATFFLTGNWAANNLDGVRQIVSAGHRVGNHSMTHPGFTGLSDAEIVAQVRRAEETIRAAGADPRPLFRFPFGERDARTIRAVNDLGYAAVRWSVDTLGWKGTGGGTAEMVSDRIMAGLQPGEIVLMHIGSNPDDGSTLDADALPQVIDRIRAAGYGFTTLDALLVQ